MYYQCSKCRELVVDQQPCKCDKKWIILVFFVIVKISFIAFCYNLVIRNNFYGIFTFSIFILGLIALITSFFYCRSNQNDRIPLNMTLLQGQYNPLLVQQNPHVYINQFNIPQPNLQQVGYYQYQNQNIVSQNNQVQIPIKQNS
ncbi:unnamed protein product [Paramecium primaurelia]|uniref:Transmembrane protein n=1 Tax=Paramecium primaurelia TaxID=5886 RepID=A0A8S1N7F7_PARPR|nr:unnamed protein product [Paramecium primaurelia]